MVFDDADFKSDDIFALGVPGREVERYRCLEMRTLASCSNI